MPITLKELSEDSRSCLLVMSFVFRSLYTPGRGATIQNNHSLRVKRRKSWEALRVTLCHSVIPLKSDRSTWPCGSCALCHNLIGPRQRLKGRDKHEWSLESSEGSSEALALWPISSNPCLSEETPVSMCLLSSWLIGFWGQQEISGLAVAVQPGCLSNQVSPNPYLWNWLLGPKCRASYTEFHHVDFGPLFLLMKYLKISASDIECVRFMESLHV